MISAMKKFLIILSAAFISTLSAKAAPAYPYPIRQLQPDGSTITIRLHGDEFYHYATDEKGNVVARSADGFYRRARKPFRNDIAINEARRIRQAQMIRRSVPGRADSETSITKGSKKFVVILVEFADLKFTVPDAKDAFHAMLNEKGYSGNGATGSVYDYYYENSGGRFDPAYDVVGPVCVSKNFADYGGNDDKGSDKDPRGAFREACTLASQQGLLNFADYDNDGDGVVDNIFFYFAGHNEAEGGSEDAIWPHASWMSGFSSHGVRAGSYACTSEYRGASGNNMAGIGTFCHEFGHVLGLPDFYDTDYEENGSAPGVYAFSLMSSGNYNDGGRTPPYLGALERWMLGWKDNLDVWTESGTKTLRPVHENEGFITPTSADDEFFLYEVRDGSGWDRYIKNNSNHQAPKGMLIYHVDMSENPVGDGTAAALWSANKLNCYSSHQCYYLMKPQVSYSDYNDLMYPGTSGTTSFNGIDWAGEETGYSISDIVYADGSATLTLSVQTGKHLSGKVTDSKGNALAGVKVSLTAENSAGMQAILRATGITSLSKVGEEAFAVTLTDSDGCYDIFIEDESLSEFTAVYSLKLFNTYSEHVSISSKRAVLNVVLYNVTEGIPATLKKHSSPNSAIGFTNTDVQSWSGTVAVLFTPEELSGFAGYKFKTINYMVSGNATTKVDKFDIFIDFGSVRAFTRSIEKPVFGSIQSVDISDAGITVPEGEKVYIGYSVKDITNQYWMSVDGRSGLKNEGLVVGTYMTEGTTFWQETGYSFIVSSDIEKQVSPFSGLGIKVINNPGGKEGYAVGTEFVPSFIDPSAGRVADTVIWFMDNQRIESGSVTLSTPGKHTVKALLTYSDGSTEEIVQVIEVK